MRQVRRRRVGATAEALRAAALAGLVALTGPVAFAQESSGTTGFGAEQKPTPAAESSAPAAEAGPSETPPPAPESADSPTVVPTVPIAPADEAAPREEGQYFETIEVTASKRVKPQRDIPGSVGAIRGADLEAMRAQGMRDYLKLVPGVHYADQGNEESLPIIRGIATSLYSYGGASQPTGVYMEEMPFADLFGSSSIPDLNPFDLDRVEVLKGPQGTLFGSGSLAGAVRYIVQKPNHGVWEGKIMGAVTQTAGSEGLGNVYAAAVNVPLFGDSLALRAVGLNRQDAGLYDMNAHDDSGNTLREGKDADRGDQQSGRVLLSWAPLDDLKISGLYFDQRTHHDDFGWADQPTELTSENIPFPSPRDHDFGGGNLLVTYELPWFQVLSSTNRMTKHNLVVQHNEFGLEQGQQNSDEYSATFLDDVEGYTQEFRLSSVPGESRNFGDWDWLLGGWEWLVGGMKMEYKNKGFQYSYVGPDQPDKTSRGEISDEDIAAAFLFSSADQVAGETALFGEVTRRLGERIEVTLGARDYETDLVADTVICGSQIVAFFQTLCLPQHLTDVQTGVNPKFSLRYLHDRNMQLYLLAAKGFQFGGVQPNPPAPGFAESSERQGYKFAPFKSSELWNYELGLRTEWLDRRLRFDIALFYLDWSDLQLQIRVPLFPTSAQFLIVANVARAHSEGLEVSLDALPFDGARWTTSAAWMNAVTDVLFDQNGPDGGVKPGTRLPGAPRFQLANVAAYEHAVPYFTSWTIGPTFTHTHMGSATDDIRARGFIGGYDTFDARLVLARAGSRFQPEISLGVNNLTDVRGSAFHLAVDSATSPTPKTYDFQRFVQPRTTMLSVSMRY